MRSKDKATASDRKKVARAIAVLVTNPATPASLYNSIIEELNFYNEFLDYESLSIIEMSLKTYEKAIADGHIDIGGAEIEETKTIG